MHSLWFNISLGRDWGSGGGGLESEREVARERVVGSGSRALALRRTRQPATHDTSGAPYILTQGAVGTISSMRDMVIVWK
jgi:hypothetical protein